MTDTSEGSDKMTHQERSRRATATARGPVVAVVVGLVVTLLGGVTSASAAHRSAAHNGVHKASASSTARRLASLVPRRTTLVHLGHPTAGFRTATSRRRDRMVADTWWSRPLVLPVIDRAGSRLKVRLPWRPNESTTWMRKKDIYITHTEYAIVVDLTTRHLYWYHDRQLMGAYPVGVGAPATPTPTGSYFLAMHSPPINASYGPVMLETSAHSNVIEHFEGGNDAIIAIHGPIGADAEIGTQGAAISHGCVRMHDSQLAKIKFLPKGTPIILTQ